MKLISKVLIISLIIAGTFGWGGVANAYRELLAG